MKNPIFFFPDAAIFTSFFLDPFSCRDFTDILFLVISFLCMILRQLRPTFLTLSLHKSSFHKAYIFPWQMKKKEKKKKAHFRSPTYRECRCAAPTVIRNRTTSNSNCNVCQTEGDGVQSFSCPPTLFTQHSLLIILSMGATGLNCKYSRISYKQPLIQKYFIHLILGVLQKLDSTKPQNRWRTTDKVWDQTDNPAG